MLRFALTSIFMTAMARADEHLHLTPFVFALLSKGGAARGGAGGGYSNCPVCRIDRERVVEECLGSCSP